MKNKQLNHITKGIVVALGVASVIYAYYLKQVYYPSTADAYIGTNLLDVTPKVSGFIQNIYVENNQFVHKGQLLLDINPEDYIVNLNKAENNKLYATEQSTAAAKNIAVTQENLAKAESNYSLAKKLADRYQNLYNNNSCSLQEYQEFINKAQIALVQVQQNKNLLAKAEAEYRANLAKLAVVNNDIENAKNYTGYTKIFAPVDGYITNLNLVKGQFVKAGDPMFGFVDSSKWWVDANFKETQLSRVKPGQIATVTLDMYNHTYQGTVKSISYSSGNTFALLPSENATGNWVKVSQRFTVRILLNNNPQFPLRVGASSDVVINTRS